MNESQCDTTTDIDQAVLDRLVDGELDGPARAAALRALEAEPGGWRRCALAFLEAQAWRDAALAADVRPADARPAVDAVRPQAMTRRSPFVRHAVGLAAAVAIAFSAGFVARSGGPTRDVASVNATGVHDAATPPVATGTHAGNTLGTDPPAPPATVPEYLRRRMEREGYEITGERKLVPVALEDGRKVAVPIDTVGYRYVGRRIH